MFPGQKIKLANFRLPESLLDELALAQHALEKPSVAEVVREALREFLKQHAGRIEAYKRFKSRHGS